MKNVIAGLEAINFDSRSKLAEHLEELFQDCIDYVESQGWDGGNKGPSYQKMHKDLVEKWSIKGEYGKRLNQIAINDIGFANIGIITELSYAIIPFASSYTNEEFVMEDLVLYDVYMRTGDLRYMIIDNQDINTNEILSRYSAALKCIGMSFDPNSGKFNIGTIKYGEDTFAKISPMISLPIDHAFLTLEQPATARELTAVYLHEFGHMINMLVGYAQNGLISNLVYHMGKDLEYPKLSQMKLPNEAELDDLLSTVELISAKAIEYASTHKDSASVVFCSKLLNFTKSLIGTSKKIAKFNKQVVGITMPIGTAVASANGVAATLGSAIACSILQAVIFVIVNIFIIKSLDSIALRRNTKYNYGVINGTKISETTSSFNTYAIDEQRADILCVRFGYGDELIAFLSRLDKTHYQTPLEDTSCALLRLGSDFLANLCGILPGLSAFGASSVDIHREGIQRIQSIINESNRYFKLYWSNRNSEFGRKMANDIQNLRKRLDEAKHAPANSLMYKILNAFFNQVISIDYLADLIITGHLGEDYTKLTEQLDDLLGNNLYYWAQAFDKIQRIGKDVDASNFVAKRN